MPETSFVAAFNPLTGQTELKSMGRDYDFVQEIARSAYADMLHDHERNELYHRAISKTVAHLKRTSHESGRPLRVLDIGTGTGLLSMMAVKAGADTVTACEAFTPVAKCAREIVQLNGMADQITVVAKRSDQLKVGPRLTDDMSEPADLLVAELFDTEMIGEGALPVYRHAKRELLTASALSVPSRGRIWAQLVESDFLYSHHEIRPPAYLLPNDSNGTRDVHEDRDNDGGEQDKKRRTAATRERTPPTRYHSFNETLHDIQLNQLVPDEHFAIISEPRVIFEFNFTDVASMPSREEQVVTFPIDRDVTRPLVVLFWWDAHMDWEGEILMSCAPYWARDDGYTRETIPWRDHWMQAVYYIPDIQHLRPKRGDHFPLKCTRDDYSFRFAHGCPSEVLPAPCGTCSWCDVHRNLSRSRIAQLNEHERLTVIRKAIERDLSGQTSTQDDSDSPPTSSSSSSSPSSSSSSSSPSPFRPRGRGRGRGTLSPYLYTILGGPPPRKKMDRSRSCHDRETLSVLFLGSVSLLEVLVLRLLPDKFDKLIIYVPDGKYDRIHSHFLRHFFPDTRQLLERVLITSNLQEISMMDIGYVVTEPQFDAADLPWHSLHAAFLMTRMRLVRPDLYTLPTVLPKRATIKALLVTFDDLWKIKAPVRSVEGFDVSPFDRLITTALDATEPRGHVESQPLADYSSQACSLPRDVFSFDLTRYGLMSSRSYVYSIEIAPTSIYRHKPLSLVFWIDYEYEAGVLGHSTGPLKYPIEVGRPIEWYRNARQAVHFLAEIKSKPPNPQKEISDQDKTTTQYSFMIRYNSRDGQLTVNPQSTDRRAPSSSGDGQRNGGRLTASSASPAAIVTTAAAAAAASSPSEGGSNNYVPVASTANSVTVTATAASLSGQQANGNNDDNNSTLVIDLNEEDEDDEVVVEDEDDDDENFLDVAGATDTVNSILNSIFEASAELEGLEQEMISD